MHFMQSGRAVTQHPSRLVHGQEKSRKRTWAEPRRLPKTSPLVPVRLLGEYDVNDPPSGENCKSPLAQIGPCDHGRTNCNAMIEIAGTTTPNCASSLPQSQPKQRTQTNDRSDSKQQQQKSSSAVLDGAHTLNRDWNCDVPAEDPSRSPKRIGGVSAASAC